MKKQSDCETREPLIRISYSRYIHKTHAKRTEQHATSAVTNTILITMRC